MGLMSNVRLSSVKFRILSIYPHSVRDHIIMYIECFGVETIPWSSSTSPWSCRLSALVLVD